MILNEGQVAHQAPSLRLSVDFCFYRRSPLSDTLTCLLRPFKSPSLAQLARLAGQWSMVSWHHPPISYVQYTSSWPSDSRLSWSTMKQEITALTRASSLHNEANNALRALGAKVIAFDLHGPKKDMVEALTGQDVVISCIHASQLEAQMNLIEPLKEAKVKRFVPCDFATPAPEGVMAMHDRVCHFKAFPHLSLRKRLVENEKLIRVLTSRNCVFSTLFNAPMCRTPLLTTGGGTKACAPRCRRARRTMASMQT